MSTINPKRPYELTDLATLLDTHYVVVDNSGFTTPKRLIATALKTYLSGTGEYDLDFDSTDLTANVLTVNHNLNKRYLGKIAIWNDADELVPEVNYLVTSVTVNQITIQFQDTVGTDPFFWHLRILK